MNGAVIPSLLLCATLAAAASSCTNKRISDIDAPAPASATPSGGTAWSIPSGALVNPRDRGSLAIDGLYPSTVPNDRRCCWVAPSAILHAREPKGATVMTLTLLVPDYPFFETHAQSIVAKLAGQETGATGLAPGVHRIDIALPPGDREPGPMSFELRTSLTFVPAHENVNTDTRALGVILLGIAFR